MLISAGSRLADSAKQGRIETGVIPTPMMNHEVPAGRDTVRNQFDPPRRLQRVTDPRRAHQDDEERTSIEAHPLQS